MAELIPAPPLPNGRVQKRIPTPFTRPSITIGATGAEAPPKRAWKVISVNDIRRGDIIPGLGVITDVVKVLVLAKAGSGMNAEEIAGQMQWTVNVTGGEDNSKQYHGADFVLAFTAV